MIRMGMGMMALALVGLFGFYYVNDSPEQSQTERAKNAAKQVGDAVRDKGVSGLVEARLVAKLGLDTTRFLHAHYDEGRVVIYGLLPPDVAPQQVSDEAGKVPGVREVELFVQARPEHMNRPLRSRESELDGAEQETDDEYAGGEDAEPVEDAADQAP